MKPTISQSNITEFKEIKKRKKTLKVLLICIVVLTGLFILGSMLPDIPVPKNKHTTVKPHTFKERIDSLMVEMKKDSGFMGIKEVEFNYKDSTLKIACEIDKKDRKHYSNTTAFDVMYKTDAFPVNYTKVYFYEKTGNHFGKLFSSSSNKLSDAVDNFKRKFCTSYYCEPLKLYLEKTMNDPDSFEPVSLNVSYSDKLDGTIIVEQTFRGKNAFGGLILNKVQAVSDTTGNILSCNRIDL